MTKQLLLVLLVCLLPLPGFARESYSIKYEYKVKPKFARPVDGTIVRIPIPKTFLGQRVDYFKTFASSSRVKQSRAVDQFGQEVVLFNLPSIRSGQEIVVGFNTLVELKPYKIYLDRSKAGSLASIPKKIKVEYTNDIQGVYDLKNSDIKRIAGQFQKNYPNIVDRVKAVHNYVASLIKYDRDGKWRSAGYTIRSRKGSCSEFCFLFSALLRSNGIPTRFVGTSRLRTRKKFPYKDKVWHRIVEAYIPPYGWVPFDPTRDRGNPPKNKFVGSYEFRSLIVMVGGGNSSVLGKTNYIGSNNNHRLLKRTRVFTWNKR